jgi:hypothetical protein
MKDGALKILGVTLITLGLLGFLMFGTNIVGFAISEESSSLEFLDIEDITLTPGDKKSIILNIKNTEKIEFTNCAILSSGEKSNWVSSKETKNMQPNSNTEFNLDIKIPENTETNDYPLTLKLTCDQDSITKKTSIAITKGVKAIKLRELKSEKDFLKIIYTFDNQGFVGENTYVEIWVLNPDGFEVNRIQDKFSIKTDKQIIRDIKIDLKERPNGVYGVFFSHPSDSENYIKKTVILGKSSTTGNVVFNVVDGKGLPYIAFLLFIAIGTFFIFRSHRKTIQEGIGPSKPSGNRNTLTPVSKV